MNILITLPKNLLEKIISGEKEFEMRKCLPKHMKIGEGFTVFASRFFEHELNELWR
jgi:hypothetical protein